MQLAIMLGFEMGTHMLPFEFGSPLCWIFWGSLLFGWGVQALLQRKRSLRFVWVVLLAVGLVACEVGCQVITGWDVLLPIVLYFYLLVMLLGALLGILAHRLCRKRKTR